jgi:hypothetical protein
MLFYFGLLSCQLINLILDRAPSGLYMVLAKVVFQTIFKRRYAILPVIDVREGESQRSYDMSRDFMRTFLEMYVNLFGATLVYVK